MIDSSCFRANGENGSRAVSICFRCLMMKIERNRNECLLGQAFIYQTLIG